MSCTCRLLPFVQGNMSAAVTPIKNKEDTLPHVSVVSAQAPSEQHTDVEGQSSSVPQSGIRLSAGNRSETGYQQVDDKTRARFSHVCRWAAPGTPEGWVHT